ncbi:MAG: hypothetical protein PHX61_07790 [Alphaproteobacteria bacterium]|nr:hypothetical protein [Alphaproteobacteria bacterium]
MKKFLFATPIVMAIILLGIGIAQEHAGTEKYKSDLEYVKTIDDPFFAKNAADRIKVGISAGEISYKELGLQNESQLDELVLKAWGKEAKRHLEWLKTVNTHGEASERSANIQAAVAANATSWKELKTNKSELDRLVLEAFDREATNDLAVLKTSSSTFQAQMKAQNIRDAVSAKATRWEKLGTNKSELDKLVLEAFDREATNDLAVLKTSSSTFQAQMKAQNIRDAVSAKATRWEKLGTNKSELPQFVLDAQGRETQNDLFFLKNREDPETFPWIAESIEKAVSDGAITWERLGTNKTELHKIIKTDRTQNMSSILLYNQLITYNFGI